MAHSRILTRLMAFKYQYCATCGAKKRRLLQGECVNCVDRYEDLLLVSNEDGSYASRDNKFVLERYMDSWVINDKENDELTDFHSFKAAKQNLITYLKRKAQ